MSETTYRKCPSCGTMNVNNDHCKSCGTLINMDLRREEERLKKAEEKRKFQQANPKKKSAFTNFIENSRSHSNWAVRIVGHALYSVWAVVIAIGAVLALVFAYVAA